MSVVTLAQVDDQIQTYWAPLYTRRLRETLLLGTLVNKEYEGAIAKQGDTVRVSQVNDPVGELLTVGTDANVFNTSALSTSKVDLVADKRAVSAYEFEDLVELQSQISRQDVQDGMVFACNKKINTYLWSLIAPSASAPDHTITDTTIGVDELAEYRRLAAEALWPDDGQRYGLLSPQYWETILKNTTLSSADYVEDSPMINGQKARRILGWNLYEDNSQTGKRAVFFHPDFLLYAAQQALQMKVSDLHSQKRFGFVLSVDLIFGAKLGIQGNVKHIEVTG